jgi:hypothetical protein
MLHCSRSACMSAAWISADKCLYPKEVIWSLGVLISTPGLQTTALKFWPAHEPQLLKPSVHCFSVTIASCRRMADKFIPRFVKFTPVYTSATSTDGEMSPSSQAQPHVRPPNA